jgi:hypothetical protein
LGRRPPDEIVRARAAALLRSPLGTLVVDTLAKRHQRGGSADPLGSRLRALSGDALTDEDDAAALYHLVLACVVDLSPHTLDHEERVRRLAVRARSLRDTALELLDRPAAENWFSDVHRAQQVWVSPAHVLQAPDESHFRADLSQFGGGTPKPRSALWTTTALGGPSSGWVTYLRIGEDGRPPPYRQWRLEVLPSARVYEVHSPEAWRSLCLEYPGDVHSGLLLPDWHAVAHHWEGVHLSVGGLLTAQRVTASGSGRRTRLDGWDSESTVWLRWAFAGAERLPDVQS